MANISISFERNKT